MPNSTTEAVHRSLKRCNRHPRFLEIFYDRFLSASPVIREKFAETDMKRQRMMLEASLYTSILAADDVPYAVDSMKRIGRLHRDLGITPELYDIWLESLIAAIVECDEAFDEAVEASWRIVLRSAIATMLAQYDARAE